ncbi:MAG TPA: FxLYD domain-containing protein [Thermomicrobiales bacterium]|jgi:hypothetical protein
MRRLLLILTPLFILALTACGVTQNGTPTAASSNSGVRVLASAAGPAGPVNTEPPLPEEVPANAVQSFTLEEPRHTATANGGMTVSGKIVNNGDKKAQPTRVIVTLLDEAGQTVSKASFSDPRFTALEPGAGLTWQGEILFGVKEKQRLEFTVEGVTEAAGQ